MRRTSTWVVVALIVGATALGAQDGVKPTPAGSTPAATGTGASVEQLLKDLGADDYRTRERAGRELVARGEKVLPQMRAAFRQTDSPEVQRRLAVMIRRMDTERLIEPKRITLAKKAMTVKEALDELAKQSGYRIEFGGGGNNERHAFEFDKTPFWVAIDKVAAAAGCVVYTDYNDDGIRVYNQDTMNPYVAYSGPFRIVATNINSSDSIQLSGMSRRGNGTHRYSNMNLSFQIQSEPKNPMLGVTQVELIRAVDEFGGSLAVPRNQNDRSNYYSNGSFRGFNTYGNVALSRGDKTARTIKVLKAKMGILLLAGTSPEILIAEPLKIKNKSFSGRTIEIDIAALNPDANNKERYTLEVTARRLGQQDPDRPDYNWSNTVWQRIELVDAQGNKYRTQGPNTSNNNGHTVQLTIPFGAEDNRGNRAPEKLGPPVKLIVNEWLSITHEVTFEFANIPLP